MLHNTVSHVKQYMTIQNMTHTMYILLCIGTCHTTVYLLHVTIGESYKDDYHLIYNKDLWGGDSLWETKKRLWLMDDLKARYWASQLSGKSSWAKSEEGPHLQIALFYTSLWTDKNIGQLMNEQHSCTHAGTLTVELHGPVLSHGNWRSTSLLAQ